MDKIFAELAQSLQSWWLKLQLAQKAPELLIALLIVIVGFYLARVVGAVVRRGLRHRKADEEISVLVSRLVHWGIIILVTLVAAQKVGLDISAFLAGLGILGFTVGFALQDVSKNFLAGMLILLQQPFSLGDMIEVAGFKGTVLEINLRDTEMRTVDGLRVRIPNADVFTSPIVNYTNLSSRRITISFGVAYTSDLARIREAAVQAIERIPGVLTNPIIDFRFETFGDTAIQASVFYWCDMRQTTYSQALDAGIRAIQGALQSNNVEIPLAPHEIASPKSRKK
ncbi:MAG: hypothetical protein DWG76_05110 [Chloroflexi bacterium]|nr:hypothetical protein [Chloroflexota bacterium]